MNIIKPYGLLVSLITEGVFDEAVRGMAIERPAAYGNKTVGDFKQSWNREVNDIGRVW